MDESCGTLPQAGNILARQEVPPRFYEDDDKRESGRGKHLGHVEAEKPDRLEDYFEHIYENECKFHAGQGEVQFIENAVESYVRLYMDSYYRLMNCCDDSACNITHCYPELLKVGSFYEQTKNNFPGEFDYILVIGSVIEMPHACHKKHSFIYHDETFIFAKNGPTFLKFEDCYHNGPAETCRFSYHKPGEEEYEITVDITIAIRCKPASISDLLKKSRIICEEFYFEIVNTGSFLFIEHDIVLHSQCGIEGPWKFSVTETERLFMKETLSEKHRKAYMILKFLINGKLGKDVLKNIHKKFSFCISSYNIKTAMIYHHYKCKREGLTVADCVVDIFEHFRKTVESVIDKVEIRPPFLRNKGTETVYIDPDLLIENKYSVRKYEEGREDDNTKEMEKIVQSFMKTPCVTVKRRHRSLIQASVDDVNIIIKCFDVFIRRLNELREDSKFSKCDHGCNNTFIEMLLEVPEFEHYFQNSARVQDLLAEVDEQKNEESLGKVMEDTFCCRWYEFR